MPKAANSKGGNADAKLSSSLSPELRRGDQARTDGGGKYSRPDVAFLGINYPPEATGIAPYTGALASGLRKRGLRVSAHVAHPHYPEWVIHEGYGQWARKEQISGVWVSRHLHYVPRPPRGVRRLLSELSFGVRLFSAGWGRPRLVIAVSPSLFATAMGLVRSRLSPGRPPFVVWVQDLYTLGLSETGEGSNLARRITRWVEAHTLRAADAVVVIHERFADFVCSELEVPSSRITVIRNWTHLPPSEPTDATVAKASLQWPSDVILAVHTGNMGAKQGLENVVDAARLADEQNVPIHFFLVGDGGERPALEERARGIARLTFVDPLEESRYRLALSAADILIVNEKPGVQAMAVPSKLTSYFDAGRPVVAATDAGGTTAAEILAAGAGVIVRAGDAGELLDAIVEMASDRETAARLSANGRRYREDSLDEGAAIQQWVTLISQLRADGRWRRWSSKN